MDKNRRRGIVDYINNTQSMKGVMIINIKEDAEYHQTNASVRQISDDDLEELATAVWNYLDKHRAAFKANQDRSLAFGYWQTVMINLFDMPTAAAGQEWLQVGVRVPDSNIGNG